MLNMGSRKGQYFSFDAIVASVIFVLTLIMLLSYWQSVRTYLDYQSNDLNKEAVRISYMLFSQPDTRDCSQLKQFGLALSLTDKRMDEKMLIDCQQVDLKKTLSSAFNVSIGVTDVYNDATKYKYVFGVSPENLPPNLKEVSRLRRVGTIATQSGIDHVAYVDIYVYR